MICETNRKIYMSLCDSQAHLSILSMYQIVQDNITELMAALKLDGMTSSKKYNSVWVYVKNKIKVTRFPVMHENLTVQSFVSKKTAVKVCVDTVFKDENGEIVAYSRLEQCPLDLTTGQVRRSNSVGIDDTFEVHDELDEIRYERFTKNPMEQIDKIVVKNTNIDCLHHTNNTEYVRMVLDQYSTKHFIDNPIKQFQMHYINQCYEGEELDVYKETIDNIDYIRFVRDDTIICEIEIEL